MNIRAIGNSVLFRFLDETAGKKNAFHEKSASGIFLVHTDRTSSSTPRWAEVLHIGPKVTDVAVGQFILIEPLQWTLGSKLDDGSKIWKTIEDKIIATSDDRAACESQATF